MLLASPTCGNTFVYVGSAASSDICVLQLDLPTGELTVVEQVPIPGIDTPGISTPMAVSPDRRFLYIGTRGVPRVAAGFAIDPANGKIKHVASGPLADSMAYLVTDRSGRFLLGASPPGHKITIHPIRPPGTVRAPLQVLPDYPNAHAILADARNRYVLVPTAGNDRINPLQLDAVAGRLTPNAQAAVSVPGGAGPRHLVFHPNGRRVYVIGERDGAIYVFDYDPDTGQLERKQAISALPPGFQGQPLAADLHVTPDGRFLYASERRSSILTGFKIDAANGLLTAIGSVPTEQQPRGFNIDPSGRYLLAVGEASDSLSIYTIDPDSGQLTKLKAYPIAASPNWVEIVAIP
ncbi:MAG: lactonase family protein [Gammaproteobacteria bacterium]